MLALVSLGLQFGLWSLKASYHHPKGRHVERRTVRYGQEAGGFQEGLWDQAP